jgi:hypothetical protein
MIEERKGKFAAPRNLMTEPVAVKYSQAAQTIENPQIQSLPEDHKHRADCDWNDAFVN